jgi:hypothetical protein
MNQQMQLLIISTETSVFFVCWAHVLVLPGLMTNRIQVRKLHTFDTCLEKIKKSPTMRHVRSSTLQSYIWLHTLFYYYSVSQLTNWSSVYLQKSPVTQKLKNLCFMEPERSLPCSQEHSIGPYPEPDLSCPYDPILSVQDQF